MESWLLKIPLILVGVLLYLGAVRLIAGTDKDYFKGGLYATTPFFTILVSAAIYKYWL